ncbi:oligosaccharide biosynthesis protein Alg14 like-domain-containing protein [Kockovaella imperatae]|uniref:UDP-N-acetylglucosamine transferase subunit ALG14 n=1 Tax=Kockovaella imperatae TaxID=4999 RepID=A0A1Y1URV8_9TREE|nr:oligosaccharide biosynthesis protein Alg14 like-domain-containing protein [Kockovaella imperatae]ORX40768.1 oligosaccharide biosynthesis protein Alg14 like-domain-containing protein [Kockovaella imperatae]
MQVLSCLSSTNHVIAGPMVVPLVVLVLLLALLLLVSRLVWICPAVRSQKPTKRQKDETCSLGVFLGSGGHTGEMKILLSSLDLERYKPRRYVVCHGDQLSLVAIANVEGTQPETQTSDYTILSLPRARRVGQPLLSTAMSTFKTILVALWHTFLLPLLQRPEEPWVDLLLVNGPGTCVVLVLVTYIRRFLGLSASRIIYVESFARVNSLSLSGKLLRPWVDTFVVQWPDAAGKGAAGLSGRVRHRGWLV